MQNVCWYVNMIAHCITPSFCCNSSSPRHLKNLSHLIESHSLIISHKTKKNFVAITDPFQSWSGMKKAHRGRRHHLKSRGCSTFPLERANMPGKFPHSMQQIQQSQNGCATVQPQEWNLQENSRTSRYKWNAKCFSAISTGSAGEN